MAYMKTPKTPAEIKKATAPTLRKEYTALADQYKKILNDELIKCPYDTETADELSTIFTNQINTD